jgi:hypothetical protein
MLGRDFIAGAMLGLVGGLTMATAGSAKADASDSELRADLETVARRRIFFGHQSVGWNLIDGLKQLSAREGVAIRWVEVERGPLAVAPATFAHGPVAENGNPEMKLESFARLMGSGPASGADVALVKFCYVDFRDDTDAARLFARYRSTVADLAARNPGTTFVHVTVPLTTTQGGPKALAKRLLGKAPGGVAENARREEFNALLREAFLGREPVFDLALVESTRPDGGRAVVVWNGRAIPVLAEVYSEDGGHLNQAGRLRAAREFLAVLGRLPATSAGAIGRAAPGAP